MNYSSFVKTDVVAYFKIQLTLEFDGLHVKFLHTLSNFSFHYFSSKIRRGPKLEGYAFANFGYSSGREGESPYDVGLFLVKGQIWSSYTVWHKK